MGGSTPHTYHRPSNAPPSEPLVACGPLP
jgi:hypothetical protein